jgi:Tfp pilus assembly protein PilF
VCACVQDEEDTIVAMKIQTNANLAMVHLKLEQPILAIECCDKVLGHDSQHVKALYRKAQAQMMLGNIDGAKVP